MNDQDLIVKIKQLKQIRPDQDWALLAKKNIMAQRQEVVTANAKFGFGDLISNLLGYRVAALSLASVFLFTGIFAAAQAALPGDVLFPVRKVAEKIEVGFTSDGEEKNIKVVNKRLDDLIKIASENRNVKLEPAMKEYNESMANAAKAMVKEEVKNDPEKLRKVIDSVKNIEERKSEIGSLGIEIKEQEGEVLDSALVELITSQVSNLEAKQLTPYQIELLDDVRVYINGGKYVNALDQIFEINQNIKEQNKNIQDDGESDNLDNSVNNIDGRSEFGKPEIGAGVQIDKIKGIIVE